MTDPDGHELTIDVLITLGKQIDKERLAIKNLTESDFTSTLALVLPKILSMDATGIIGTTTNSAHGIPRGEKGNDDCNYANVFLTIRGV